MVNPKNSVHLKSVIGQKDPFEISCGPKFSLDPSNNFTVSQCKDDCLLIVPAKLNCKANHGEHADQCSVSFHTNDKHIF